MAELRSGNVVVQVSDSLLAEQAGKLSLAERQRIPKGRKTQNGLGQACEDASHDMTQAGADLVPPEGVNAASLLETGRRVIELDKTIRDTEIVLGALKQSRLLLVAEADEQLRKLNDQVKAQGKYKPQLFARFAKLFSFFSRPRKPKTLAEKAAQKPAKDGNSD
jgi:hypothetical protein